MLDYMLARFWVQVLVVRNFEAPVACQDLLDAVAGRGVYTVVDYRGGVELVVGGHIAGVVWEGTNKFLVATCMPLTILDRMMLFRRRPSWARADYSRGGERLAVHGRLDISAGRCSRLGMAPLEHAAHVGQILLLRAAVPVVQVEEVTGVQAQASGQSD